MVGANVNQQTAVALFLDVPIFSILCMSSALYGAFAIQFELTEVLRNDLSGDFFKPPFWGKNSYNTTGILHEMHLGQPTCYKEPPRPKFPPPSDSLCKASTTPSAFAVPAFINQSEFWFLYE